MTKPIHDEEHMDLLFLHVLDALPPGERALAAAQFSACPDCRHEIERLRPVIDSFVSWPTDVLRPAPTLWNRLAGRIAKEAGGQPPVPLYTKAVRDEWEEVAPGISCKLLSSDIEAHRVTMLVRLAPGTDYPPHRHAGVEELHLLHGELMIDEQKLHAGDFIRAESGSVDKRVWSETGCTCLLVTSTKDELLL